MEKIIETKTVTTYIGACPVCVAVQRSQTSGKYVGSMCDECAVGIQCKKYEPLMVGAIQRWGKPELVDVLCFTCKRVEDKLSDSMMLAGAVIESVEFMDDALYTINIVSPDGTRGSIDTLEGSGTIDYYPAGGIK